MRQHLRRRPSWRGRRRMDFTTTADRHISISHSHINTIPPNRVYSAHRINLSDVARMTSAVFLSARHYSS